MWGKAAKSTVVFGHFVLHLRIIPYCRTVAGLAYGRRQPFRQRVTGLGEGRLLLLLMVSALYYGRFVVVDVVVVVAS